MKQFIFLLSTLFLSDTFCQDNTRINLQGSAKLRITWSWNTDKTVNSVLSSGDKLTVKTQSQSGIEVLLTHKNISKRLISIEEREDLFIKCFEYDFDNDGNKEIIIASSPEIASLNVIIFKYSEGFFEIVGNFQSMDEIILEKNVIVLPIGSQGLRSEFCYLDGLFYELIYHHPKPTE